MPVAVHGRDFGILLILQDAWIGHGRPLEAVDDVEVFWSREVNGRHGGVTASSLSIFC